MTECGACKLENGDGAQFCGHCGASIAPQPVVAACEPAAGESARTPAEYDDPRQVELWREALESFHLDGQIDSDEAERLAQLRGELRVSPATLARIEADVRRQFRPRVAVRVQWAAFAPVRAGSHVSVVVQIDNIDPETYEHAACELLIDPLHYRQSESLGKFRYLAKERRNFKFRVTEAGAIPAELRVALIPREGLPIVFRSRSGDLQFTVQPAETPGAVIYNVQAERIVGDFGVDKGINIGSTVDGPTVPRAAAADEWRSIVLEIAPELSEALAAERDRKARRQLFPRPARYRSGRLQVTTGSTARVVTWVIGASATLGRNSTTPGAGYACNDIALRVEPTTDPQNAAATQQISGHAHLTLRYDGQRMLVIDGSTHGTVVNRTGSLGRGESVILEDRLDVRVAGVLDLLLEAFRSAARAGDAPLAPSPAGAPRDALDAAWVGFDRPGMLDAVRIRRPGNLGGELEHLLIVRQVRIGSSPYDAIQLRGVGICERHARLLADAGQLWIERLAEDGAVRLNGEALELGQRVGLRGGDVIEVGEARLILATDPALETSVARP